MSGFTRTPNYSLYKPTPNADNDAWGGHLNTNADILDTLLGPGGAAPFLPLSGGTVTGATAFNAGLSFQNGSGGVGSISTSPNWGCMIQGRSAAVADIGLQASDGTVPLRILPNTVVQVGWLAGFGPTQILSGSQVPTQQMNFGYGLIGSSTTTGYNYGFNFGLVTDTLSQPAATHTTMNVLTQPGAGWAGSRIGLSVAAQVIGNTNLAASVATGAGSVTALSGIATSQYNQGGVVTGYGTTQFGYGSLWGSVIQSTLQAGASYYNGNNIVELDSYVDATANVIENNGLLIVQYQANAGQGVLADIALRLGAGTPTKGWKNGIVIGSNIYGFGLDPNGYGLQFQRGPGTTATAVTAGGIDLNQVDFTGSGPFGGGFAYRSPATQILNSGFHQIGPGQLSFTGSAFSVDTPWQYVAAVAVAAGGINFSVGDVLHSKDGTILRVTAIGGGGAITTVTAIRTGWALTGSLPANPVAVTTWGRAGTNVGSGATVNLTWSPITTLNIGNAAASQINIGRTSGNIGFNGVGPITKPTGYTAPTGTATRATFATGSVTLSVLAEHVKALIDDMTSYGLIGP